MCYLQNGYFGKVYPYSPEATLLKAFKRFALDI